MAIKINLGFGRYLTELNSNKLSQIEHDFGDRCVMCREILDEDTRTAEHIFPKWLQNRFNLWNTKITLPNKSQTPYRQFTIPCCKECNGGPMSEWERLIQQATEKGFDEFIKLDEDIIAWWLLKIYYSKLVKELSYKENMRDPHSPMMVSESQLLQYKNIYLYMCNLLKGITYNKPKPYELYVFRTQGDNDFDYLDDISRHVVYMQMNDMLIVCSFDSFSLFAVQYKKELQKLNKLEYVHPIQALELFAKITYFKTHYKFNTQHETQISSTGVMINSEITDIEQTRDFDLLELHLLLCNVFKMRGVETNNLPFVEEKMFSTILAKERPTEDT